MRNVTLQSEFIPLTIEGLPALAAEKKAEGARFVQMLCVNTEEGIDRSKAPASTTKSTAATTAPWG